MSYTLHCEACGQDNLLKNPVRSDQNLVKQESSVPGPGEHSVCMHCIAALRLNEDGKWYELTPEQWVELGLDERKMLKKFQVVMAIRKEAQAHA